MPLKALYHDGADIEKACYWTDRIASQLIDTDRKLDRYEDDKLDGKDEQIDQHERPDLECELVPRSKWHVVDAYYLRDVGEAERKDTANGDRKIPLLRMNVLIA